MRINKLILLILLLVSTLSFKEKPIHNKSNKSERMKIEVWSDVVCPFCLIGKKKLEKAIKSLNAEDKIEIVWRSFQLDPNIPENNSIPSLSYLSERKGYPLESIK